MQINESIFLYRLEVQQGVHSLGLGVVVLQVHVSSVLGSPLGDDDGQSWRKRHHAVRSPIGDF